MAEHCDKVIRVQGDKLCELIGYDPGTKIDLEIIRAIATGSAGDLFVMDGKSVELTMRIIAIAQILLEKIENGPV